MSAQDNDEIVSTSEGTEIVSNTDEVKFNKLEGGSINIPEGSSVLDAIIKRPTDELRPWATVSLPSRGHYYENVIPGGVVRVRAMNMATDKILATQRLAQSGKSLDYLFKNCVDLPKNFSPFSLIAGDRLFLLYYLRGITHGNLYEFTVECSNCDGKSDLQYDLNNLEIQWDDGSLGEEPFKVILPYLTQMTGREVFVKVRFLRGYDMLKLTQDLKRNRKIRPNKFDENELKDADSLVIDETLSANLTNLIVEVGSGNERTDDSMLINKFVDRLHSSDHAVIREFLNDSMPGVNTEITVECEHCGHEMKMALPITESFFRPSK